MSSVKRTFSTRKGALVLYSEDFADKFEGVLPTFTAEDYSVHSKPTIRAPKVPKKETYQAFDSVIEDAEPKQEKEENLKTCGDLYRSILSFGKVSMFK